MATTCLHCSSSTSDSESRYHWMFEKVGAAVGLVCPPCTRASLDVIEGRFDTPALAARSA